MPPSTMFPVAGSKPTCPAVKIMPLVLMACEYGPMALGASEVEMTSRMTMFYHGMRECNKKALPGERPACPHHDHWLLVVGFLVVVFLLTVVFSVLLCLAMTPVLILAYVASGITFFDTSWCLLA